MHILFEIQAEHDVSMCRLSCMSEGGRLALARGELIDRELFLARLVKHTGNSDTDFFYEIYYAMRHLSHFLRAD